MRGDREGSSRALQSAIHTHAEGKYSDGSRTAETSAVSIHEAAATAQRNGREREGAPPAGLDRPSDAAAFALPAFQQREKHPVNSLPNKDSLTLMKMETTAMPWGLLAASV